MSVLPWLPTEPPGPEDQFFGVDRTPRAWPAPPKLTRRQRLGRWLGNVLLRWGRLLGGDDW